MHKEHKYFLLPTDEEEQTIWKYMDFWKFKDLIETRTLYIPSVRQMGDQYEGKIPDKIKKAYVDNHNRKGHFAVARTIEELGDYEKIKDYRISSWNISGNESFAFWKAYTIGRSGVAIKSNVTNLINALQDDTFWQHIGKINYYTEHSDYFFDGNIYNLILNKYAYYSSENELRICNRIPANEKEKNPFLKNLQDVRVNVDLEVLIDQVYVAPNATEYELDQIQKLLDLHGLKKDVIISGINDKWSNK